MDGVTEFYENPCMTYSSTLTSKNQTTLPKAVVAVLGAKPSTVLAYEVMEDKSVRLTAKSASFADHLDSFPKRRPKHSVTIDDMKKAVIHGAARRFKKAAR
jgi:bifunctional DNA-binding transcriptional regulator/antitoxin component of YhaV-PrlF toxin-antitoxin module